MWGSSSRIGLDTVWRNGIRFEPGRAADCFDEVSGSQEAARTGGVG